MYNIDEKASGAGEPPETVPGLLAYRARTAGEEQAVVCDDTAATYAALDRDSREIGARLLAAGIGGGDRVGLLMPNGIDWAVAAYAVARIGAVLVPLSTLLRPRELEAQLRTVEVAALIIVRAYRDRRYAEDLEEVLPGALSPTAGTHPYLPSLRRVWVWGEGLAVEGAFADGPPGPAVRPDDDFVILFTSGSRGAPKGTVHTHGSALRAVSGGLEARCVRPGERLYIPMPFFWAGGFAGGLLTALAAGATLLTERSPEPGRTIGFLKRERVTVFRGWPQQGARIAAHPSFDPSELPGLRPGSLDAVLPEELRARPGARANLFGMTETFGPYAGYRLDTDMPPEKHGSCGRPFAGVEVRVVDPETRRPVPAGGSGEILLRGPMLMRGVHGRRDGEVFDADGYYATGDLGRLDEDGYLWYEGRLDDMFKVSGATVYPVEVEQALRSLPGVRQVFVTDVERASRREVGAVLVGEGLDPAGLAAAGRAVLSSFKVPSLWLVLPDETGIPRLASDKPDVSALRRLLRDRGVRAAS
ncbi:class I adenylate-forming enzyme family protein [Actinocorallia libanotica]|uniref:Class I adenylate-forming enzyme family protein n=1 Tax=Actinocorallia libanotica TaxID=46162 RepID=A0ABP4C4E4_9ACTN